MKVDNKEPALLKALCHNIRLDCFVIASLVTKSNYYG